MLLIHHAAHRGFRYPPGSLSGLADCLMAHAQVVEIDVAPLADGDFALVHDARLEAATDGHGPVAAATAAQLAGLHRRWRGAITNEPVGLLSQAIELLCDHPATQELQLDLKPHAPLTEAVLERLLRLVEPVTRRVRVTSVADWALRRLAVLDADLATGFDPLLYLDVERSAGSDAGTPPLRMGAYGYLDEHPLATQQWGSPADYLATRAEALWAQTPARVWYIRGATLARSLDDGFDWIAWLHGRGAQVAAWTLDADQPHQLDLARQLAAQGVDRITTNDAPRLAEALKVTGSSESAGHF
jgi:glycerophosphoryl diester phosphodiesterase